MFPLSLIVAGTCNTLRDKKHAGPLFGDLVGFTRVAELNWA